MKGKFLRSAAFGFIISLLSLPVAYLVTLLYHGKELDPIRNMLMGVFGWHIEAASKLFSFGWLPASHATSTPMMFIYAFLIGGVIYSIVIFCGFVLVRMLRPKS